MMNYQYNNQRSGSRDFSNRREPRKESFSDDFKRIKEYIASNNSSKLIEVAKSVASELAVKISKSQLRKLLEEIIKIKIEINQLDIDLDQPNIPLEQSIINKLAVLRPRFAYSVARVNEHIFKDFHKNILDKWLSEVNSFTKKELEFLHLFIESLIAYHKVDARK